jgi:hypothetical protein
MTGRRWLFIGRLACLVVFSHRVIALARGILVVAVP